MMRIAVLAHVRHPIAPPFMGGIEAHCWHLVRALRARGHEVTLFASGDSDPDLAPVPVVARHYEAVFPWHEHRGSAPLTAHLDAAYGEALAKIAAGGFDIVHNNSLHRFPPRFARAAGVPMVTSLHVPPFDVLARAVVDSESPWHVMTVTSRDQLGQWWRRPPFTARVVGNGIDLDDWPYGAGGDGAVWAGRICANKAPAMAAAAARMAGIDLTLYGMIEEPAYFDAELAPLLGGGVRYGGHLERAALARALGRAGVALVTPVWSEPFGLAAIEALACGTPVAAFDAGAVREVVGEACGRYAAPGDVPGLAHAMGAASALPRPACRARVAARFSVSAMIAAYEDAYGAAIAGLQTPASPPAYAECQLPAALDPHRSAVAIRRGA